MNQQKFLETLSSMPPLYHTLPGSEFDPEKSEVVNWMIAQPGFRLWLFSRMQNSERIAFDPQARKWHGVPRGPVGRPPKVPVVELD